ncbi:MAG: hypothetical protein HQL56_13090 [Magnetococcales bacterium]|nr:hypothetical protein [Magnetococcales bacterium]
MKAVGFTEELAEVQARTLSGVFKTNLEELATRRDLKELVLTTKREIAVGTEKVRREIAEAKDETIK